MLIEFRVENHRSLRDEQVLTFEADPSLGEDSRVRHVPGYDKGLLTSVGIYGANASGKSNVLDALAFMRHAVLDSHRFWTPEGGVPRVAFAWGPHRSQPTLFQARALVEGAVHDYGFVLDDERVVEEWLDVSTDGVAQKWFERDGENFRFHGALTGENKLISGMTRPNALFLSAAAQSNHLQLMPLFVWFSGIAFVERGQNPRESAWAKALAESLWVVLENWRHRSAKLAEPRSAEPAESRSVKPSESSDMNGIVEVLRAADVGIIDMKRENGLVMVRHQSSHPDAWLPLEAESRGTRALFDMAPQIQTSLRRGTPLIVDELEASLHPLICRWLLRQYTDPHTNPHGAQLLFSTHDVNLLAAPETLLRRDQCWLTEKDAEGATRLYPLTDYEGKPGENMELGYLQGRYGGVPVLGRFPSEGGES